MITTLQPTSRGAWHAWLVKHHRSETEVRLVFHKKHTGKPRLAYVDAIEEALCFGWVDNVVKRIDADTFSLKFTPRREGSRWSEVNKRRLRKLIKKGRMTALGMERAGSALAAKPAKAEGAIPAAVKKALSAHPKAWENFRKLSPGRQRAYIRLMTEAKTAETRQARVQQAIHQLEQNTGSLDDIPAFLKKALKAGGIAWENFQNLAPSYRRHYVGWILHAKQEATRQRRLTEAVALLKENKKLGLK